MNINIIAVTEINLEQLREIATKTFTETFGDSNSEENMVQYVDDRLNLDTLRTEINTEGSSFFLAMDGLDVVGYLKTNIGQSQTELKDADSLEIERIYVSRAYQGRGAGNILFQKAIQKAKNKNKSYVWLGVWEHNQKALKFYEKNGFEVFDKHIFKLGEDEQIDLLMRLNI